MAIRKKRNALRSTLKQVHQWWESQKHKNVVVERIETSPCGSLLALRRRTHEQSRRAPAILTQRRAAMVHSQESWNTHLHGVSEHAFACWMCQDCCCVPAVRVCHSTKFTHAHTPCIY